MTGAIRFGEQEARVGGAWGSSRGSAAFTRVYAASNYEQRTHHRFAQSQGRGFQNSKSQALSSRGAPIFKPQNPAKKPRPYSPKVLGEYGCANSGSGCANSGSHLNITFNN